MSYLIIITIDISASVMLRVWDLKRRGGMEFIKIQMEVKVTGRIYDQLVPHRHALQ